MNECIHCHIADDEVKQYPAFHWDAGGAHRIAGLFYWIHPSCYKEWYSSLIAGLANLDEVMDYCEYFVRGEGRDGFYCRDGKRYPVSGGWDGYHLNTEELSGFKSFLQENGWLNDWFVIKEKYKRFI